VVITGGLAVGHGIFERDPGDLERIDPAKASIILALDSGSCRYMLSYPTPAFLETVEVAPQRDLHQVRQGPREFHATGTCVSASLRLLSPGANRANSSCPK
jgi:hypothetical protein